jgi:hypothetical protein
MCVHNACAYPPSLSGTYIGPAGAIVLAGGMATNCTVQQLHLARIGVGGVGTAALARSVTGHPALRLLDLSWNVGDVDEGYAKRDRLEELEAAQAKVELPSLCAPQCAPIAFSALAVVGG